MRHVSYREAQIALRATISKHVHCEDVDLGLEVAIQDIITIVNNSWRNAIASTKAKPIDLPESGPIKLQVAFNTNVIKPAPRKVVDRELKLIADAANRLFDVIGDAHGPTYNKILDSGIEIYKLQGICAVLSKACRSIDTSDIERKLPKSKPKGGEQAITEVLDGIFTERTGRPGSLTVNPDDHSASGDFLNLVRDVFKDLGIKTSAVSCVTTLKRERAARRARTKEA